VQINIDGFQALNRGNSFPERWRINGNVFVRPGSSIPDMLSQLQHVLLEHPIIHQASTLFHSELVCPGFQFSDGHPARLRVKRALQSCGLSVNPKTASGGSDANWFTQFGIPTLNLGIGVSKAHSPLESIRSENMSVMTDVVCAFCVIP
jgi:di/tripeptidase